ncbi:MAG: MerR family transcriptional regulator [Solirubrobacterales bacterium]
MKELYSIGETAKLLGVSIQTLRYYDKVGLLEPVHINNETGYRYYSFNQFHYIDRIKYLQHFGLTLEEIKIIISSGSVDKLLPFLENQKQKFILEQKKIMETIKDIDWYMHYFTYMDNNKYTGTPYKIKLEKRYAISVPCFHDEELASMEIRLAGAKSRKELKELSFLRQYGYLMDYDLLVNQKFCPNQYFIYLKEKPDFETEFLLELPEGEYLCFRAKLCTRQWDTALISEFFQYKNTPAFVIANEFEDNFVEYNNADYEVQILL